MINMSGVVILFKVTASRDFLSGNKELEKFLTDRYDDFIKCVSDLTSYELGSNSELINHVKSYNLYEIPAIVDYLMVLCSDIINGVNHLIDMVLTTYIPDDYIDAVKIIDELHIVEGSDIMNLHFCVEHLC